MKRMKKTGKAAWFGVVCWVLFALMTLSEARQVDWDKPFAKPLNLIHITETNTMYGPEKKDVYILDPGTPKDGVFPTPDGSGGWFINKAYIKGGPFNTPREVCNAVIGIDPNKLFLLPFNCDQMAPAPEKPPAQEEQAKLQAKLQYDKFMEIYNKIWSIYGFYHEEFNGTPGNIRYARIAKNWQNYDKNIETLLDIIDKLAGPTDLDAQAQAEGFPNWNYQLETRIYNLHQDLDILIKETAKIGVGSEEANAAMKKACAAKTRAQAKPLAEQSIKAASQVISRYKTIKWRFTESEKVRDKYMALRSELISLESGTMLYRDAYKAMIDSKKVIERDVKDLDYDYLEKKVQRFDELVAELDKFHSQLNRVVYPYKDRDWAKAMKDDAHAAGVRVGTITKVIKSTKNYNLRRLVETFRDRRGSVSTPDRFDVFIGVGKKFDTLLELVSSIQELHKLIKPAAVAARDDAKKALACAKRLPD